MIQRVMTASEFAEHRAELPDAGQWAELVRGVPVTLQPPDLEHGTIVLNLSKVFSEYAHQSLLGYACFALGLLVEQRPDTVFHPAACYFTSGARFAEADKAFTDVAPQLVVELLTTNDRRRQMNDRITAYLKWGISTLWLVEPQSRAVHVIRKSQTNPERYGPLETLSGDPVLPGLKLRVESLFADPKWA